MTNCHYMRTSLVGTSSRGCVYFSCFFFLYLITFRLRELPQQQKASNITHQGEAAHTSTVNDIHNFDYHKDGRVFFIYYLLNLLLLGYVQQRVDATGCLATTMTTTPQIAISPVDRDMCRGFSFKFPYQLFDLARHQVLPGDHEEGKYQLKNARVARQDQIFLYIYPYSVSSLETCQR